MKYKDAFSCYVQFCAQGSVDAGFQYLKSIENPSKRILHLMKRIESRFYLEPPKLRWKTRSNWIRIVLTAYAYYFIDVMAKKVNNEKAETILLERLSLLPSCAHCVDLDEAEEAIKKEFESIGWHFLGGFTLPFRGPYIYETQEEKNYEIELPLGKRDLKVVFMRDFHMLSWLDFACFGKAGTGGWAKEDGIYCVESKYQIDSEDFRVSYLKHEAQHFDDYIRFPHLKQGHQAQLEFRAKLVELIYAESLKGFLKFVNEAENEPEVPHLYASFRLVEELKSQLGVDDDELASILDREVISKAAREVYLADTKKLESGLIALG